VLRCFVWIVSTWDLYSFKVYRIEKKNISDECWMYISCQKSVFVRWAVLVKINEVYARLHIKSGLYVISTNQNWNYSRYFGVDPQLNFYRNIYNSFWEESCWQMGRHSTSIHVHFVKVIAKTEAAYSSETLASICKTACTQCPHPEDYVWSIMPAVRFILTATMAKKEFILNTKLEPVAYFWKMLFCLLTLFKRQSG
jgi:hypothetical protein